LGLVDARLLVQRCRTVWLDDHGRNAEISLQVAALRNATRHRNWRSRRGCGSGRRAASTGDEQCRHQ
jgi:hypothetical protein